jgi:hypothetical protein
MNSTKEKKYMTDLHQSHVEWIKELTFYKDDLTILQKRLEEVVSKNTDKEMMTSIEHFQNMFILQRNEIDFLLHEIKLKEQELIEYAKAHPVAIDHVKFKESIFLVDRMNQFEDIWKDMRNEFMPFISKWM